MDKFGKMALHHGCRGGSLDNVRTLLENITDQSMYEARSSGGVTPLMNAVMSGNPYIVGFCLNHSFNPFMQDYMGQTCLDYAAPFVRVGGGHKISDLLNTAIA